jgi:hypothetical protein
MSSGPSPARPGRPGRPACGLGEGVERGAQVLTDLAADFIGMGNEASSRLPYWLSHLAAVFGTDLVDPGNIVRGIAGQGQEITDQFGANTEFFMTTSRS